MKILIKMIYGASIFLEQSYYNVSLFFTTANNKTTWTKCLFDEELNRTILIIHYTEYNKTDFHIDFLTLYLKSISYSIKSDKDCIWFLKQYCRALRPVKEFYSK